MSIKNTFFLRLVLVLILYAVTVPGGISQAQNSPDKLHLASICSQTSDESQWRIMNPFNRDISVTYSIDGSSEVGSVMVKAHDETFFYTKKAESLSIYYDDEGGNLQNIMASSGLETCIVDCPGDADRYFFEVGITDIEASDGDKTIMIPDLMCEGQVAVLSFEEGSYMDLYKDGSGAHLVASVKVESGGCDFNGKHFTLDIMFDPMADNHGLSSLAAMGIDESRLKDLIAALSIRTDGFKIRQSGSNTYASLTGSSSLGKFEFKAAITEEDDKLTFVFAYLFGPFQGMVSLDAKLKISCPTHTVLNYTLVNAETNEDIMPIKDGDVIDLGQLPTNKLNIRANTNPEEVGSVVFDLNDKKNFQTENVNPYSLAGNFTGGAYRSWIPMPGKYTVTATPYAMANGKGKAGTSLTIHFEVIDSDHQQQIADFTLVNADTDEDIGPLMEGDVIDLSNLPTRNLNIRANAHPADVGSVIFDLNNKKNFQTENVNPYSLAGNFTGGSYRSWTPEPGKYMMTATPYTMADGKGAAGRPLTINFEVTDGGQQQQVKSFTLVNAATDEDIVTLKDSDVINIAALPTFDLKIRANTSPENVGSVVFDLKNIKNIKTDNNAPYTIEGQDIGKFISMVSIMGEHSLMATPYTMADGGGEAGKPLKLTFHLIFDKSKSEMVTNSSGARMEVVNIYPNPVEDHLSISYSGKFDDKTSLIIYDQYGKSSNVSSMLINERSTMLDINISELQLKSGIYFLKISSENEEGKMIKLIKK